ncbi:MAG: hypothetical protein BEN18_02025 [Epulopiscium sp. Nuni2H_MBin001]|nr:MAG: hypothetical protein BEN18_02025 [Epulopiscium sp. Nuni2H_MBin001]
MNKLIKTGIIICIIIAGIVGLGVWAYNEVVYTPHGDMVVDNFAAEPLFSYEEIVEPQHVEEANTINKTVAVFGTDLDGYITDTILVVNINSITNKIKVVSIPRDTKVEWTSAQQSALENRRGFSVSSTKINEMTAYAGIDNIKDFTVKQIEMLLGIEIDNYVVVSLSAFKDVVDAVGGVEMYVPVDMYYVDSYQGLYIDLEEGLQLLDGDKAEMLVRYRSYPTGDVQRIAVQQEFLQAFAKTVLSPSIVTKIPELVSVFFTSVRTDATIGEIFSYYDYVKGIDISDITFQTLPGEGQYIGAVSYFIPDIDNMASFVRDIFFEHLPDDEFQLAYTDIDEVHELVENEAQEDVVYYDDGVLIDKTVSIQVLNGTGVGGAASVAKDILEADGYVVDNIDTYNEQAQSITQINVRDFDYARQFKAYYPVSLIRVDETLEYDVQIVLH